MTQIPAHTRSHLVLAITLLALMMATAACRPKPKRVVIGVAVSGVYHPGIVQAVKEINADGGIEGVPIELMGMNWMVTDIYNAGDVLKWAHRFAENPDLLAVIGHSDSTSTLSAAAFYNQYKIPQIVTIATNPAITNIGAWTYRLCLSDAVQGPALADYAVNDWGKKRILVFYVNDDYGRGLAQSFIQEVNKRGGVIVSSIMHRNTLQDDDKTLIRSVLQRLRKDPPDLIALFQRPAAALWTIQTARELGLKSDILGGDNLSSTDFVNGPARLTNGVRVSQFFLTSSTDPRTVHFVQALRQITHQEPDYGSAFAYDAIYLIRDAVAHGGFSRAGVKSYLDQLVQKQTSTDGAGGSYKLNRLHDADRPLFIVSLHDGRQELVKVLHAAN